MASEDKAFRGLPWSSTRSVHHSLTLAAFAHWASVISRVYHFWIHSSPPKPDRVWSSLVLPYQPVQRHKPYSMSSMDAGASSSRLSLTPLRWHQTEIKLWWNFCEMRLCEDFRIKKTMGAKARIKWSKTKCIDKNVTYSFREKILETMWRNGSQLGKHGLKE
jgi:hypothetical protein